jgi:hypothetical protein
MKQYSPAITSTTDPITGFDITSLEDRPHVVEGDKATGLTIYFETKATRQTYLDMPVERPEQDLSKTLSNPTGNYSD